MRGIQISLVAAAAASLSLLVGCQSQCLDDGAAWKQSLEACENGDASASSTSTGTESDSASATMTATMGSTSAAVTTASTMTMGSMSDSMSTTDTTTGGSTTWCEDKDGDGFGDPNACMPGTPGQDPPPGYAPNGDDCDDSSDKVFPGAAEKESMDACMADLDDDGFGDSMPTGPGVMPGTDCDDGDANTFPGAAPNDSADACMTDADGDDWGDSMPDGPGVTPGTDCDDSNAFIFPGAAELESDTECKKDEDDDGYGDANVPPGVTPGADCFDENADLNPGKRVLFSVLDGGAIGSVDLMSGMVSNYASVDISMIDGEWTVVSAAVSPEDGFVYAANAAGSRLARMDYCDGGPPAELAPHGRSICGLAFNAAAELYGVDSTADELVQFDPMTGMEIGATKITVGGQLVNIGSCGMAYECGTGKVLVTDGPQSRVLRIDVADGSGEVVADIDAGAWGAVGQAYDPVTGKVLTNNGTTLYEIALDGSNMFKVVTTLSTSLNDLEYGPVCM